MTNVADVLKAEIKENRRLILKLIDIVENDQKSRQLEIELSQEADTEFNNQEMLDDWKEKNLEPEHLESNGLTFPYINGSAPTSPVQLKPVEIEPEGCLPKDRPCKPSMELGEKEMTKYRRDLKQLLNNPRPLVYYCWLRNMSYSNDQTFQILNALDYSTLTGARILRQVGTARRRGLLSVEDGAYSINELEERIGLSDD